MSNELSRQIEKAAAELEKRLPVSDLSPEKIEHATALLARVRKAKEPLKEGHIVDPFARSKAVNDLRELLQFCKDVIIPYEMKKQIANLRAVAKMAESA